MGGAYAVENIHLDGVHCIMAVIIMMKDPICVMDVLENGTGYIRHFKHETAYFC